MDSNRKYVTAISKLNRLTQEGKIRWTRRSVPKGLTRGTEDYIDSFYSAKHKDKFLGVYELRYRTYDSESDSFFWTSQLVLALFTADWSKLWEFPPTSGTTELLRSIEYQVSGVEDFVDGLLSESDVDESENQ
jgi:hypothetical protein